ncbi:alpha/beta fold hydrolase [Halopiger goleimassiliensis]|uniref:alpha/beta fold hydrolase n=1 Tax=Halopiger goleimassiliensis TaxID=1293048 RepID=UPI0012B57DFC|nr:alpha/beta hydrolase [Halopiger goleimassiliensis]
MALPLHTDAGYLGGTHPYVRVGDGPKTLLVLPGIGDALFDGEYGRARTALAWSRFRQFTDEYTVYLVSRPRGLADDASIETMAADYARVLESSIGLGSVLGLSMGGLIAQELARIRPSLVDRLVLGVSGCRVAADARPILRELHGHAIDRNWTAIRSRLYEEMYTGMRRRLYPSLSNVIGRLRPPTPAESRDVVVSFEAVRDYDGTDRLERIDRRTLVIGADEDPFFPEGILRETHAGLPDSQLALFTGARHGVFLEQKQAFDNWVRRFLAGEAATVRRRTG